MQWTRSFFKKYGQDPEDPLRDMEEYGSAQAAKQDAVKIYVAFVLKLRAARKEYEKLIAESKKIMDENQCVEKLRHAALTTAKETKARALYIEANRLYI